jgi:hypothetical protein
MALTTADFMIKHVLSQELDLANVSKAPDSIVAYLQKRIDMISRRESEILVNEDLLH